MPCLLVGSLSSLREECRLCRRLASQPAAQSPPAHRRAARSNGPPPTAHSAQSDVGRYCKRARSSEGSQLRASEPLGPLGGHEVSGAAATGGATDSCVSLRFRAVVCAHFFCCSLDTRAVLVTGIFRVFRGLRWLLIHKQQASKQGRIGGHGRVARRCGGRARRCESS
jgi:hypothetical protein